MWSQSRTGPQGLSFQPLHFIARETEVQRGRGAGPRSHLQVRTVGMLPQPQPWPLHHLQLEGSSLLSWMLPFPSLPFPDRLQQHRALGFLACPRRLIMSLHHWVLIILEGPKHLPGPCVCSIFLTVNRFSFFSLCSQENPRLLAGSTPSYLSEDSCTQEEERSLRGQGSTPCTGWGN